jgi:uncharacterized membrane protein (Fun14 family)
MTTPNNPPPNTGLGTRLGHALRVFLRALVRLLLIVCVLALLGLALYYGVPAVYSRFIQPVQENTLRIESLQTSQAQTDQLAAQNMTDAQNHIGTLESQYNRDSQAMVTVQAHLNNIEARSGDDVSQIKASSERLDALNSSIKQIFSDMAAITTTLKTDKTNIQELADKIHAGDPAIKTLYQDLQLVKAMELITRSRLFLGQNNLGLAQVDIQAAHDLLNGLQNQVEPYQAEEVNAVVQRLNLALGNLPGAPVLAADDLEIAWQMLIRGLPNKTPEPAGALTGNIPGTPTITISLTSTISATLQPLTTAVPQIILTPSPEFTVTPAAPTPKP